MYCNPDSRLTTTVPKMIRCRVGRGVRIFSTLNLPPYCRGSWVVYWVQKNRVTATGGNTPDCLFYVQHMAEAHVLFLLDKTYSAMRWTSYRLEWASSWARESLTLLSPSLLDSSVRLLFSESLKEIYYCRCWHAGMIQKTLLVSLLSIAPSMLCAFPRATGQRRICQNISETMRHEWSVADCLGWWTGCSQGKKLIAIIAAVPDSRCSSLRPKLPLYVTWWHFIFHEGIIDSADWARTLTEPWHPLFPMMPEALTASLTGIGRIALAVTGKLHAQILLLAWMAAEVCYLLQLWPCVGMSGVETVDMKVFDCSEQK